MTPPTIELKKFHYAAFASDETNCYDAEVWVNGKRAFHASNGGTGGGDHYTPFPKGKDAEGHYLFGHAEMKEAMGILEAYAKTLPPSKASFDDPKTGKPFEMEEDVESLIGAAVQAKLEDRVFVRFFRNLNKKIYFIKEGDRGISYITNKNKDTLALQGGIDYVRKHYPTATVLNGLPEAEVRRLVKGKL